MRVFVLFLRGNRLLVIILFFHAVVIFVIKVTVILAVFIKALPIFVLLIVVIQHVLGLNLELLILILMCLTSLNHPLTLIINWSFFTKIRLD